MVKITLYNIGGPKEVVFIIIFYTSFVLIVCVPDSSKEPKEDMYLEYNVLMLRILPLRVLHSSVSFSNLQRYPFSHTASTLYMNQSMMASPCEIILKYF